MLHIIAGLTKLVRIIELAGLVKKALKKLKKKP